MISILFVIYSLLIFCGHSQSLTDNNDIISIITKEIQPLLNVLIKEVNGELPAIITGAGLDPYDQVYSTQTSEKINIGICKAKATAKVSLKNMKGLSSLYIKDISAITPSITVQGLNFTLSATLDAALTDKLKFDVTGSCKAKCGLISEKVKLTGSVKVSNVKSSGNVNINGYINAAQTEIVVTAAKLQNMKIKYGDIDVTIKGLGIFNDLLKPIVDAIDALFGNEIVKSLTPTIQNEINKAIKDELPISEKL